MYPSFDPIWAWDSPVQGLGDFRKWSKTSLVFLFLLLTPLCLQVLTYWSGSQIQQLFWLVTQGLFTGQYSFSFSQLVWRSFFFFSSNGCRVHEPVPFVENQFTWPPRKLLHRHVDCIPVTPLCTTRFSVPILLGEETAPPSPFPPPPPPGVDPIFKKNWM